MTTRFKLFLSSVCLLTVVACGNQEASVEEGLATAKDAAGEVTTKAGELSSAVANLSQDKVEEIAKIAAKLESAPAEAMKMLEEHGWTKDEFEKMVSQIQENEASKKIFEAAKKAAGQH